MTDYLTVIRQLEGLFRRVEGKDFSLQDTLLLNAAFGHPDKQYPIIHVAGTNGKGSVVTKLAQLLQNNGYRVGAYTSPHLSCFRERIQINGELVSEEQITPLLTQGFSHCERLGIPPTFFELTTCAALRHFADARVDIAVVEVGLGGRLDATNIIQPVLSVITSISLDHTQLLGDTCEAIAQEKGGIIKHRVPVVLGPKANLDILHHIAKKQEAPVYTVKGDYVSFDEENQATARQCAELLAQQFSIQPETITPSLQAKPPCRLQYIPTGSGVILDVAHNSDGIARLIKSLHNVYRGRPFRIVCGFSADKEVASILHQLTAAATHIHLVAADHPRAMPIQTLSTILSETVLANQHITTHSSVENGIHHALTSAHHTQELVVICGSFFLMQQARHALGLSQPIDPQTFSETLQKM